MSVSYEEFARKAAAGDPVMDEPDSEAGAELPADAVGRLADAWADPIPLPDLRVPVPPFDPELLPARLRPWLGDISERMQCPPEFPAVGALVALASLVGRQLGIRPKRHDDWLVVPNLWGAVVGRPGVMKSPALEEVTKPAHAARVEAVKAHEAAMVEFETDTAAHEAMLAATRKAHAEGGDQAGRRHAHLRQGAETTGRARACAGRSATVRARGAATAPVSHQ